MKRALAGLLILATALPVLAEAPQQSLRPVARQADAQVASPPQASAESTARTPAEAAAAAESGTYATPTPARNASAIVPEDLGVRQQAEPKRRGLLGIFRPRERTNRVEKTARAVEARRRQNMVCGDPKLQGIAIGRVAAETGGCGIDQAVRLQSVAGIGLTTHAVMDCTTAMSLKAWVESAVKPVIGSRGGGVKDLQVAAHYACRSRNNQKGAKISEHGRGRAIDISGFRLNDGTTIDVLTGWNSRQDGKALRSMHRLACGPFGTVLGPNSDRFHANHFHLDTARYRSGSYCR